MASSNAIFSVKCIEMQSDQNGPFSVTMIPAMIKKQNLPSDKAFDKFTHTVMFITCILICINLPSCSGLLLGSTLCTTVLMHAIPGYPLYIPKTHITSAFRGIFLIRCTLCQNEFTLSLL